MNPGCYLKNHPAGKVCISFTIASLLFLSSIQYAQNIQTDPVKPRRNELGIDVMGVVRQFMTAGNSLDFYTPNYYLTYRHHFKKSNLRMGLGGFGVENTQTVPAGAGSSVRQYERIFAIDYRIGYEWFSSIGNKWQILYGLDLRPTFLYSKYGEHYVGSGYTHYNELFSHIYGLAPIFGFRFKPVERISIIVESSVAFNIQFANIKDFYDYSDGTPDYEQWTAPRTRFYTSYYQPVSVSFTYDL